MKKIISVIMIMLFLIVSGCDARYGRKVYSCNPANTLGFKAAYIKGEHITFVFDKEYAVSDDEEYGHMRWIFNYSELPDDTYFYLVTDFGHYTLLDSDNLTIDKEDLTISFNKKGTSAQEVRGFGLSTGSQSWSINFNSGVIEEWMLGGEMAVTYIQNYDSIKRSWSPTESSHDHYPMSD